ncbi:MAG: PQQ-dependent sugar dehydrogenase [Phycisphaerales bacterium]|nr:PQQ-dependent sugar dehydrogenase [Phycisphaerales bacterium]
MSTKKLLLPAMVALCALAGATEGATALTAERIVFGMSRPVLVTHAPGDTSRIFVVEQRSGTIGRIRIIELGTDTLLPTPFLEISPVATGSEQGLLGLAFDPDYDTNGYFYVNYTDSSWNTRIVRYQVSAGDPNVANAASATPVLSITQPDSNHNGGWLAFGPDGYLYIAQGDGGSGFDPWGSFGNGQNTNVLLGKLLRIDPSGDDFPGDATRNYAIPPDNPFVGVSGADEIWAYGLRNPWRNSFDRETGDLYIADVGQNVIEEIDFQPASSTGGENYGWRCMEGLDCTTLSGCTCNAPTLELPFQTYTHGGAPFRCSITGGYVYRGCAIPDLRGTYFYADYCSNQIWSLRYDGMTVTEFMDRSAELDTPAFTINSITSFGEDAFGEMYICDLGGEIYRIIPEPGQLGDCCAIAQADVDHNGIVNLVDLNAVLFGFGVSYTLDDLNEVLFRFGSDCTTP